MTTIPTRDELIDALPFELKGDEATLLDRPVNGATLAILNALGPGYDTHIWRHVGQGGINLTTIASIANAWPAEAKAAVAAARSLHGDGVDVNLYRVAVDLGDAAFEAVITAMRIRRAGKRGQWPAAEPRFMVDGQEVDEESYRAWADEGRASAGIDHDENDVDEEGGPF